MLQKVVKHEIHETMLSKITQESVTKICEL